MGFTAMGFFFIFFPEEESTTIITKKKRSKNANLSLLKSINNFLNPSNSTHLFPKAQFIISICVLLIFITFLFFTISTFEPSPIIQKPKPLSVATSMSSSSKIHYFWSIRHALFDNFKKFEQHKFQQQALQGLGTLYRKGTRSMSDLVIAHVAESVTVQELKLFTRLIFRSKISSKSDIVFVFQSESSPFNNAIVEENTSFLKLVNGYKENFLNPDMKQISISNQSANDNTTESTRSSNESADDNTAESIRLSNESAHDNTTESSRLNNSVSNFDVTQFLFSSKKANVSAEPIWGRKKQINFSGENDSTESTRLSYGSVVGFYADELDPENSLSGFMDHVPMNLRRWACYTMLLGRTRRNFKHIMLVDLKEVLLLGDPLSRVKNLSHDSVLVTTVTQFSHRPKNLEKTHSILKRQASLAIIMGGSRGIQRLSNTMLIEIIRASMQQKKRKNSVAESTLFNQLVRNEFLLKNVDLISNELIAQLTSLNELDKKSASLLLSKFSMIRCGNSNVDINSVFKKYLCSFPLESIAYSDC